MFSHTLFITYMFMCFLGLGAITLILIIIKHNKAQNAGLLKATMYFAVCTFILGAFYFINYYRELVVHSYTTDSFLRGVDAVIFYGMGFSWLKLMDAIMDVQSPFMKHCRKLINIVTFLCLLLSIFNYVFLLDEYYNTNHYGIRIYIAVSEIVMGLSLLIFILIQLGAGYKELADQESRRYVMGISILVNFNNIWNNFVAIGLFLEVFSSSLWTAKLYGITSIILLVINFITVRYVYKKDFSPLYFQSDIRSDLKEVLSEENLLNEIARKHKLTEREREVMLLAYNGMTNPDIAEELIISRYTVKRHMHNLYEKLDVTSRMELIHLVKSQSNIKS